MSPFIFSNSLAPRLARHLAFWGMYIICYFLAFLPTIGVDTFMDHQLLKAAMFNTLAYLPIYLLSTYGTLYFMLPRYLATRNGRALTFYVVFSLTASITLGYFITKLIFLTDGYIGDKLDVLSMTLQHCLVDFIAITGSALIIKIMKDYYHEQQENEALVIESIRNKLEFQKLQMHPRLLFTSLDRIQLEMDMDTGQAAEMILKLSDLLSYLLYESKSDSVLVSKETSMIRNYIALKTLENKDGIHINFQVSDQQENLSIAPGLLLPLLEIGIGQQVTGPRERQVVISLSTSGDRIYFSLNNNAKGYEILNEPFVLSTIHSVKERLQSAYFQRFKLEVQPSTDSFLITLQLTGDNKDVRYRLPKVAKT